MMPIPRVLAIAGSDASGGAGIQADLKTIGLLGGHAMTVVTAVTVQDTTNVHAIYEIPPEIVARQMEVVIADIGVDAAKTGMLCSAPVIEVVAEIIRRHRIKKLVVDPVLAATGGTTLLPPPARETLVRVLIPLAWVVTPNIPEAEVLTDLIITSPSDMKAAARIIYEWGPRHVLITGGHLPSGSVHVLYDGRNFYEIPFTRIDTTDTHGSGCTFSAAIATELARGQGLQEAIERAESFVNIAIRHALRLGKGYGPLNQWAVLAHRSPNDTSHEG